VLKKSRFKKRDFLCILYAFIWNNSINIEIREREISQNTGGIK